MLTTKWRKRTETKRNSLLVSYGGNRLMSHGVHLAESVELQWMHLADILAMNAPGRHFGLRYTVFTSWFLSVNK